MRRRLTSIAAIALLTAAAWSASAQAQEDPPESLLLIMDSSGSMNEVDDAGVPLIEGAKQALRVLVSALPDGSHVGLRVYGHRVPNTDQANGCLDTELVIPVGPIDREAMRTAIDGYEAKGFTPIGLSLREAASDLPSTGRRTIVLVSDGIDTCAPPDPCQVATELAAAGLDFRIHTVGMFLDDPAAEAQLTCIAEASGGRFIQVDSIVDLTRELAGIAGEALPLGSSELTVLQGSLEMVGAPPVPLERVANPNWEAYTAAVVGTIGAGETRWFAVEVGEGTHLQTTAHLNAWQLEPAADEFLEVQIVTASGEAVGVPYEILGVLAGAPQRTYLVDALQYTPFGDPVPATAVTGPRSAPPGWNPTETPYFVERFRSAGVNGGLYERWKADAADPVLPPATYFIGVTWSASRAALSELELLVLQYPAGPEPAERDRPQTLQVLAGGVGIDPPVTLTLQPWTGGTLMGGATPARSLEVWTPLTPDEPQTYSLELTEGEVVEIGYGIGVCCGVRVDIGVDLQLGMETGVPAYQRDLETDGAFRITRDPPVAAWEAPSAGTYLLTVDPGTFSEADADAEPGVALAMFVFSPDPEAAVATTTLPADDGGDQVQAVTSEEDPGFPAVVVVAVAAGAVVLAALLLWLLQRRRR